MTEAEYLKNLRLALEETNKILLNIGNFYWTLSSFILLGTGFAVSKALGWEGKDERLVIYGIIMIAAWILFLLFTKNSTKKAEHFANRVKYFENNLEIYISPAQKIKSGVPFQTVMIIAAYLSCCIWCLFIIKYFIEPTPLNGCIFGIVFY